jgi:hypothetical protein
MILTISISEVSQHDQVILDRILFSYNRTRESDSLLTVEQAMLVFLDGNLLVPARQAVGMERLESIGMIEKAGDLSDKDLADLKNILDR